MGYSTGGNGYRGKGSGKNASQNVCHKKVDMGSGPSKMGKPMMNLPLNGKNSQWKTQGGVKRPTDSSLYK